MNIELYNSLSEQIRNKLDVYALIGIPISIQQEVRMMLSNALNEHCKIKKDYDEKNYGAIMMAFYYETSRKYPTFNFLTTFYANFFDLNNNDVKTKKLLQKMKEDKIIYDAFFEIASVDTIKKVYFYVQNNILFDKENKDFYQMVMEKIESPQIDNKAVVIDSIPLDYSAATEKISDINQSIEDIKQEDSFTSNNETSNERINNLEKQKETIQHTIEKRQETLFGEAAKVLDVETSELLKEAGGKNLNLDIDRIVIMPDVLKKIPVKNLNKSRFRTMKDKIKRERLLENLDFDSITRNKLNILIIKPMKTVFDKIASGDKPSIDKVMENASKKEGIASSITFLDEKEFFEIMDRLAKTYNPETAKKYIDSLPFENEISVPKDSLELLNDINVSLGYSDFITPVAQGESKFNVVEPANNIDGEGDYSAYPDDGSNIVPFNMKK